MSPGQDTKQIVLVSFPQKSCFNTILAIWVHFVETNISLDSLYKKFEIQYVGVQQLDQSKINQFSISAVWSKFRQNYATLNVITHYFSIFSMFCGIMRHKSKPSQQWCARDIYLFLCYYYTDNCYWFLNLSYINKQFNLKATISRRVRVFFIFFKI